ncbi:ATP-dependent nuclease [Thermosediminibacter litoriperuensis]|uniref:Putative ATP-dependent endonuclease of OLD family n=1 Tax=Thermosediminibacter litoriperuensis TaxID=291989 RepID=A0A5S5AD41_9FIRM|nr:AAA family ATPase [Thermosediminibacter litoriperuensis]TYP47425.1 putative ATP-dependent endonuclease of OLD family [Thermosediminibacter litoriperuensis]
MYISKLRIKNYRCFRDVEIEFNEGLNVIIGENNTGKTAIMKALQYVFNHYNTNAPTIDDFNKTIEIGPIPPEITITLTLRSSKNDKIEDKALVASWLTKLETPWEATLTYKYFLPETNIKEYEEEINKISPTSDEKVKESWAILEKYLPKYVSRIYGGNIESKNRVESEYLSKFHCEMLDALRDVESKMFTGKNTLLKQVLNYIKDYKFKKDKSEQGKEELNKVQKEFKKHADKLVENMINRLDNSNILELAEKTGAAVGGIPVWAGKLEEGDVLSALKLMIRNKTGIEVPVVNNGMGYNNLIYISLLLSKFEMITSSDFGENAKIFPILLIEEPEAHLHPALQYNFLRYLKEQIDNQGISRQIFITTHSTHITAAVGLDPIICMNRNEQDEIFPAYPGKVFSDSEEDQKSKKYVERYLDATKSTMLFAKSVLFGEGIAEQILLPVLAEYMNLNFDKNHVSIVRVDGSTFKHFIKIFGAGVEEERKKFALHKRVACIVDTDPARKKRGQKSKWESCWPFEIDLEPQLYKYRKISSVVCNLLSATLHCDNVKVFYNESGKGKTLEYDIAFENAESPLIYDSVPNSEINWPSLCNWSEEDKRKSQKAASYYLYVKDKKGEVAFDLAYKLKENLKAPTKESFKIPDYIKRAFKWVCYVDEAEED